MSSYRDADRNSAWKDLDGFGEDDEIDEDEYKYATRDHVLFCIDASKSMQEPLESPDGGPAKSPLHMALEAVLKVQRGKVMSGPNDSVGVMLWNVDPAKEPMTIPSNKEGQPDTVLENFRPGTYLFESLRQISAEEIKRVKAFLDEAQEELDSGEVDGQPNIISDQFPPCDPEEELDIADVFECCNHVFRDAGANLNGQKRVFLITDNPKPERGETFIDGRDTRNPARTRFLDLYSLGVQVDPFFIGRKGEFDEDAYWNDILYRSSMDDNGSDDVKATRSSTSSGLSKLQELMEEQVYKTSSKRVLFSAPMRFGGKNGEIVISVNGYSIVAETKKPGYRYYDMSGRAAEEVQTKTTYVAAATGDSINKDQIGYAYAFGKGDAVAALQDNYWTDEGSEDGKEEVRLKMKEETGDSGDKRFRQEEMPKPQIKTRIAFRDEEIKDFKTMGMKPQIKILGFHDPSNLAFFHNVKHSVFIYPNEKVFTGSTRTFAALLASCIRRKRYGLALCVFRANSTPVFCCMIPQVETLLPNGSQDQAPGFHLIPLPFVDDIRSRPEKIVPESTQHCNDEERDSMVQVVNKLRMKQKIYVPSAYPNPSLAYFYAKLQSLAFEEEFFDPLQTDDQSKPLTAGMHAAAGKLMKAFNESVMSDVRVQYSGEASKAVKKRAAPADDGEEEIDDSFVLGHYKNDKLNSLLVKQLKAYAKKHHIEVDGGKKADYVAAVADHFAAGGPTSEDRKPKKAKR